MTLLLVSLPLMVLAVALALVPLLLTIGRQGAEVDTSLTRTGRFATDELARAA